MYPKFLKRVIDFAGSLMLFIILSPIIVIIGILLAISFRGNPFFIQRRPGKNERLFSIIKFKTMNDRVNEKGELLPDGERLTPVGRFIRKTSLDELPQLVNVLKGEMSFIGPRPLLPRYLPYYTEEEKKRHHVRPGITGFAQVSGRNLLSWDSRLAKDVTYVDNLTLSMDLWIFFRTFKQIIRSKDVAVLPTTIMKDLDEERRL